MSERTLGQIAYEAQNHTGRWHLSNHEPWERSAAAVRDEVMKRQPANELLLKAAKEAFFAFEMHYDGADDSKTQWMGRHLMELEAAIELAERSTK